MIWGPEVTLPEMLDARERRAARQKALLERHGCTLVSYGLNIPGPHKTADLLQKVFYLGKERIATALEQAGLQPVHTEWAEYPTGYEGFLCLQADALEVKKALVMVEERDALGRLLDIDVLDAAGAKVSRSDLGMPGRTCLLCDNPAFVCARSRAHSVNQMVRHIEAVARKALGE